ncbi:MAG: AIR synthase-related protein [Alphaproteobacteria bacterium]|nr:AIR synthase-related protein [Alphaproteobacteria bacterium]
MTYRIEILAHKDDGRGLEIKKIMAGLGKTVNVRVIDVYTSENETAANDVFKNALGNPVTQKINQTPDDFDWALEIGFLPGVTDNIGHTASELLSLTKMHPDESQDLKIPDQVRDAKDEKVYSSKLYLISGNVKKGDIEALAATLSNKLIQRSSIKDSATYKKDGGMEKIVPKVKLDNKNVSADKIDLNISDKELEEIGKNGIENLDGSRRGPLGLSLLYMKAIQEYFKKEGRPATDIEIETLAQTWSEHCKHTIFASPIDEVKDGLYKHYIKRATKEIREKRQQQASSLRRQESSAKSNQIPDQVRDDIYWRDEDRIGDICVSVFSDNAGGIIFDENYLITDKVETHNSPSALDPFGGSITGIVGVNRDCIGFGQGAKPVINRYGFCLADPRTKPQYFRDAKCTNPILSPATIMHGVVAGVESGGNCSGIPTPQGFVVFDDRFVGKPLVFVGTIGLIPREINGRAGHVKKASAGDKIVMVGGRVGQDGIHGATFSSVALDEGSPATAVQIGDPITQKKMSDAIIKEIRDLDWYSAITDNGAGGLSSSVGEMAEQSGGFHVELEKVPLKYPGMSPWEIWISESQERMTLAVPEENTEKLIKHLAKRGVEATVIGTYTDSGRAVISWDGETILDLEMEFLHDGNPETPLKTTFVRGGEEEPKHPLPQSLSLKGEGSASAQGEGQHVILKLLARPNICSKEFISTQYDHNVQGSAVLGPLQGRGRVYAETSITRPVLSSPKGVVLSQGLFPRYSDIDAGAMAAASLDMAVRNAVAAGVDFNQLALLDNFCWCSSDEPERLGQLKRAVEVIYEMAVKYETPFISGKDSMFNDFKGYDKDGKAVKISVPPTLLVSSIGVIPHVQHAISLAPKAEGDLVYLLGETKDELGASEYYDMNGVLGNNVPETDTHQNLRLYKLYARASRDRLIASAYALGYGGLAAALAKKAIAAQMGMEIDLSSLCHPDQGDSRMEGSKKDSSTTDLKSSARNDKKGLSAEKVLFSESTGRILVTVAPQNKKAFEKNFKGFEQCHYIGSVSYSENLMIRDVASLKVKDLEAAYKNTFREL